MARILILEEKPEVSVFYSEELESKGHRVFKRHDCRKALELLDQTPIDLVVFDLSLQDVTGPDFAKEMLMRQNKLKVISYMACSSTGADFKAGDRNRKYDEYPHATRMKKSIEHTLESLPVFSRRMPVKA